jgi:DNA invertase Pin-like site-specific DNA recombinase
MAKPTRGADRAGGVTTALLYTRVSSDEQKREGLSLDAQVAACRRYAAERGWILGPEYTDVLSGRRDDRPQYQKLLADVRQLRAEGRSVVVVVAWLHRFGRRVLERVARREELKALGVAVHSAREGGEVSDLVSNILASVAEEEVRQLGERVSAVIRHAQENGWHHVGRPRWGYCWRPATDGERALGAPTHVLDVHPDEAPFAREAWRRVADGASLLAVARWAAALPAAARGGRSLRRIEITKLMHAPVYAGRHESGPADVLARPVGRWPRLVDDATWSRVQDRIAGHRRLPHQAGIVTAIGVGVRWCGRTPRCLTVPRSTNAIAFPVS